MTVQQLTESQLDPAVAIHDVELPAGEPWMYELKRGQTLRILDLKGNQAVDTLFYNAHDPAERYSAVDTIREQGSIYLTTGSVLLSDEGKIHAIPELTGMAANLEMSHEAAVGKIDQREIEYLMSRGLDEDEAVSTIVRGFLNVDIDGLPSGLQEKLDKAVADTQKDMM